MVEKKMMLQELSHMYTLHPFIIILNFHSIPVKRWKSVKNSIYNLHQSVKLKVVQNQLLKKVEHEPHFQRMVSLCKGPTCFLLCYSLEEFKDIAMKVFKQSQDKMPMKDFPEFSFIGAKYQNTFIQEIDLKKLLTFRPNFDHVTCLKAPSQELYGHLNHPLRKLLKVFMANNGN